MAFEPSILNTTETGWEHECKIEIGLNHGLFGAVETHGEPLQVGANDGCDQLLVGHCIHLPG
jgi:hypothetical protein